MESSMSTQYDYATTKLRRAINKQHTLYAKLYKTDVLCEYTGETAELDADIMVQYKSAEKSVCRAQNALAELMAKKREADVIAFFDDGHMIVNSAIYIAFKQAVLTSQKTCRGINRLYDTNVKRIDKLPQEVTHGFMFNPAPHSYMDNTLRKAMVLANIEMYNATAEDEKNTRFSNGFIYTTLNRAFPSLVKTYSKSIEKHSDALFQAAACILQHVGSSEKQANANQKYKSLRKITKSSPTFLAYCDTVYTNNNPHADGIKFTSIATECTTKYALAASVLLLLNALPYYGSRELQKLLGAHNIDMVYLQLLVEMNSLYSTATSEILMYQLKYTEDYKERSLMLARHTRAYIEGDANKCSTIGPENQSAMPLLKLLNYGEAVIGMPVSVSSLIETPLDPDDDEVALAAFIVLAQDCGCELSRADLITLYRLFNGTALTLTQAFDALKEKDPSANIYDEHGHSAAARENELLKQKLAECEASLQRAIAEKHEAEDRAMAARKALACKPKEQSDVKAMRKELEKLRSIVYMREASTDRDGDDEDDFIEENEPGSEDESDENTIDESMFPYTDTPPYAVCLGGRDKWVDIMATRFPQIRFLGVSCTCDTAIFRRAAIIIFQTNHISHKCWGRAAQIAKDHNIPIYYLTQKSRNLNSMQIIEYSKKYAAEHGSTNSDATDKKDDVPTKA